MRNCRPFKKSHAEQPNPGGALMSARRLSQSRQKRRSPLIPSLLEHVPAAPTTRARVSIGVIVCLGIGLACAAAVWMVASWSMFGPCSDTILSEAASPDGSWVATLFERDCGATTYYSTQLSLRPATKRFKPDKQPSAIVVQTEGCIQYWWEGQSNLVVRLPDDARVFRQEQWQDGITIRYVPNTGLESAVPHPSSPTARDGRQ